MGRAENSGLKPVSAVHEPCYTWLMQRALAPATFFALVGAAIPSIAAPTYYPSSIRTTTLIELCRKSPNASEASFCSGYIMASFDRLVFDRRICSSPTVTPQQVVAVVNKYLNDHPENWSRHPGVLINEALAPAFPCR